MTEIKIFANYGCLAAEKKVVYTYGNPQETAVTSDEITVQVPEDFEASKTATGDIILTAPWGYDYLVNEILSDKDDAPVFDVYDSDYKHHVYPLEVEIQ